MNTKFYDYPRLTRTPWYSLVFILPLVVLYELLALLINWDSADQLRNGADVLVRQILEVFGLSTPYILGILFAAGVIGAWLWHRRQHSSSAVKGGYLAGMLLESLLWAGLMLVFLNGTDSLFMMITTSDPVLQGAFLAIGAGLYEEGVFRLVLVTGLATFFQRVMDWQQQIAWGIAIAAAAAVFSLFHFIGGTGELFTWNSFGYRSVAGIILGLLFTYRGFGITVYTHTIYNFLVLGIQTIG